MFKKSKGEKQQSSGAKHPLASTYDFNTVYHYASFTSSSSKIWLKF